MRADPPTFYCDSPGCRSYCQLVGGDRDYDKDLEDRGWKVFDGKHYCPGCAVVIRSRVHVPDDE